MIKNLPGFLAFFSVRDYNFNRAKRQSAKMKIFTPLYGGAQPKGMVIDENADSGGTDKIAQGEAGRQQ